MNTAKDLGQKSKKNEFKNFWENSSVKNIFWTSQIHRQQTCWNFFTEVRTTLGSKSEKNWRKNKNSPQKKTISSNISSVHVKCCFWQTFQLFLARSLFLTLKVRQKLKKSVEWNSFLINFASIPQMQVWQCCQTLTPKSWSFCSKSENN